MAEPDISKVISLIMSNEELVRQIKSLTASEGDSAESDKNEVIPESVTTEAILPKIAEEEYITPESGTGARRARRGELLRALKPYVSGERREAIESMMSIADILGMMRDT